MMKQTPEARRLRDDLQRMAGIKENLERIARLEQEVDAKDKEIERLLLVIKNIVDILRLGGYLAGPENISERMI